MSEDYYRILTPKFRDEINASISKQTSELNTCADNALVNAQKLGLQALQTMVNALPDGYPMPMKKN